MKKNWNEILAEVAASDVSYQMSANARRIVVHTEEGIGIITENKRLFIPLEELVGLKQQIEIAIIGCVEEFKELPMGDKMQMAKEKTMSYGQLQAVVTTIDEEVRSICQ